MENKRFTILYTFETIPEKEQDFIDSWKQLTQLIYEFKGSFGSRLHKVKDHFYLAYAQWPSKAIFESDEFKLPKVAETIRARMRSSCLEIKTLIEAEEIVDLLKQSKHSNFS